MFGRESPSSVTGDGDYFQEEKITLAQLGESPEPNPSAPGGASPDPLLSRSGEDNSGMEPDMANISIEPTKGLVIENTMINDESGTKVVDR